MAIECAGLTMMGTSLGLHRCGRLCRVCCQGIWSFSGNEEISRSPVRRQRPTSRRQFRLPHPRPRAHEALGWRAQHSDLGTIIESARRWRQNGRQRPGTRIASNQPQLDVPAAPNLFAI